MRRHATAQRRAAVKPSAVIGLFTAKCTIYGARMCHDLGVTAVQAAGAFGNLGHESAGFHTLQEVGQRNGRGGWGWEQATGTRRAQMLAWCKSKKLNPASDEGNYGWLIHELQTTEAASLHALKQQHTLEGATQSFMTHFERPGKPMLASRLSWAKKALPAIQKGLSSHQAGVAAVQAASIPTPAPKAKPKADKHAVASKPKVVRKRAVAVHHVTHHVHHRKH